MPRPDLIALYSPAMGCGKSTITGHLCDRYGFTVIKMAGPLKNMIRSFLGSLGFTPHTIERMVEGDMKEAPIPLLGGVTTRHLLQTLGTEWGRAQVNRDVWVIAARATIQAALDAGQRVVVDDVRFPNEHELLAELGATMVRVDRPTVVPVNGHTSEGQLNGFSFDHRINNSGTLSELYTATDLLLKS